MSLSANECLEVDLSGRQASRLRTLNYKRQITADGGDKTMRRSGRRVCPSMISCIVSFAHC